jgi:hypothetical protein
MKRGSRLRLVLAGGCAALLVLAAVAAAAWWRAHPAHRATTLVRVGGDSNPCACTHRIEP